MIERVDITTGGASAMYGSDAVAGTVNLVTRREFDGAESQIYYGGAREGAERIQASQMFGQKFERGGFVVAYDYARDWPFDLTDTDIMRVPSLTGLTPRRLDMIADARRHSGFLAGRYAVSNDIELYADGLYTSREMSRTNEIMRNGSLINVLNGSTASDQWSVGLGSRIDLNRWQLDVGYNMSETDNFERSRSVQPLTNFVSASAIDTNSEISSASATLDGPLFSLSGQEVTAAVGVERRKESTGSFNPSNGSTLHVERTIESAFGEIRIPFGGTAEPGLGRFDVSLAGRYDDYEDAGSTFNPQYGLIWKPMSGFTARAAYSTAFRAPDLIGQANPYSGLISTFLDPKAAGGRSPGLFLTGTKPDLMPEDATTWSVGFDVQPIAVPWLKVSLSYFDVHYEDRLDVPVIGGATNILVNEHLYTSLLDRQPTAAQLTELLAGASQIQNLTSVPFNPNTRDGQALLAAMPNIIVFDNRTSNIATETVRGLDLNVGSSFDTHIGLLQLGLNGTYTLEHERKVTDTSPLFELLNEPGKPVDLRLRITAGWSRDAYSAVLFANYVDSYSDTAAVPPAKIDSWTTLDLVLRYVVPSASGPLSNLAATLSVRNVLDEAPPEYLRNPNGIGFDPANADAMGRYLSISFSKKW